MMLREIFWIQERGSERSMVMRRIFTPKREDVRGRWCSGQNNDPRERK